MMIIMKVGVVLENNVLPHSKSTKQGHQGSLLGIRNCLQWVTVPAALFSWPRYCGWAPSTTFPLSAVPQILIFIKNKAKPSNQDLPTISTILTEEKIHYEGYPHPVTFWVGFCTRRAVTSEDSFSGFPSVPQSLLHPQGCNSGGSTYCWEGNSIVTAGNRRYSHSIRELKLTTEAKKSFEHSQFR